MTSWNPTDADIGSLIDRCALPYAGGTLTAVARGSMGKVWRLDLVGPTVLDTGIPGHRLMIKEFFWGADQDAERNAQLEAEFCRRAARAGVILTQGVPARDGTYVQTVPTATGEVIIRVNTWAGGRHVRSIDAGRAEYLGNTLGTLHALRHPTMSQPDPYFTTPPAADAWSALLDRVAATTERIPDLAAILARRLPNLLALVRQVDTGPQPDLIFSHRDVKPENVLRDEATGVATLIDWDEAGPISPSRELASQLCVWHVHDGTVDREAIRRTMESYRTAGGYGTVDSMATFSLRLANDLNYIHDEVLAALDLDLPEDMRSYARSEAERFIIDAPSLRTLESIMEAAAG